MDEIERVNEDKRGNCQVLVNENQENTLHYEYLILGCESRKMF